MTKWVIILLAIFAFMPLAQAAPEAVPAEAVVKVEPVEPFLDATDPEFRAKLDRAADVAGTVVISKDEFARRTAALKEKAEQINAQLKRQRHTIWQEGYMKGFDAAMTRKKK